MAHWPHPSGIRQAEAAEARDKSWGVRKWADVLKWMAAGVVILGLAMLGLASSGWVLAQSWSGRAQPKGYSEITSEVSGWFRTVISKVSQEQFLEARLRKAPGNRWSPMTVIGEDGTVLATASLVYLGDTVAMVQSGHTMPEAELRDGFETILKAVGFSPFDGRLVSGAGTEFWYRAYFNPLPVSGAPNPSGGTKAQTLATAAFNNRGLVFALMIHGGPSLAPESVVGGQSLPERLLMGALSGGLSLSQLGAGQSSIAPAIAHPVSRIGRASCVVEDQRMRCAFMTGDGDPVIWRGLPVTMTIYDGEGSVRLRSVVMDSHLLSLLGPGIELPMGAKRLELSGGAGNLFRWDIPGTGP